jgi:hypothetical protein
MTELTRREDEFLLYQTEDGQTRVEVRFDGETAWLSLGQMADLFPPETRRRRQVLRRAARAYPRRPVVGEGVLTQGARHLRDQYRL